MLEKYKNILHISLSRHQLIDDIVFYRMDKLNISDKIIYGVENLNNYLNNSNFDIILFHFINELVIEVILDFLSKKKDLKFGLYLHTYFPFSEDGTFLCKKTTNNKNLIDFISRMDFFISQDNISYNFVNNYLKNNDLNGNNVLLNQPVNEANVKGNSKELSRFRVGFVGVFSYIKGFDFLKTFLKTYGTYLYDNGIDFIFYTLDKSGKNIIFDEIKIENKIKKNINIFVNEHDRKKIYSNLDSLLIPSIWNETGPMVLYEAFLNKIPVIISDQESLKEKVLNRVDSYVFKTGDEKDLLKGILWMKQNHKKIILNSQGYKYNRIEEFNNQLIDFLDGL